MRIGALRETAPGAELTIQSNATVLAAAWRTATVRTVAKAVPGGLAEGFRLCGMASELRYLLAGLRADIERLNWRAAEPHRIDTAGQGDTVRY